MALETPAWLNLCFVEKILRKSESDNSIQVIDIFTKPATSKGDNYTSDLFRVIVEYTHEQGERKITNKKSIIIKIAPTTEGSRKDLIMESRIFETEMLMMTNMLEKMNKLLGPDHILNGKGIYMQKENPMLLVIEDLAPLGFHMADRQVGLDMDHCILALQGIARFHAASVAVCEKEPHQKQMFKRGLFSDDQSIEIKKFFTLSIKSLANEVAKWPELGKKYSEKMDKFSDHVNDIGIQLFKCNENDFNVIIHGDFWVNNMLFKYDNNGKPIAHIFVDFQLSCYSSPVLDLHYFLSTSPSPDIFENNKDDLLKEYHKTLVKVMKQLNCKTQSPTMEQLKEMMKKKIVYEMISSFTVLPLMLVSKSDAKDLDEIMATNGTFQNPAIENEVYRKIITKRILKYDKMSLLDI